MNARPPRQLVPRLPLTPPSVPLPGIGDSDGPFSTEEIR
jgi:hypothetical protein